MCATVSQYMLRVVTATVLIAAILLVLTLLSRRSIHTLQPATVSTSRSAVHQAISAAAQFPIGTNVEAAFDDAVRFLWGSDGRTQAGTDPALPLETNEAWPPSAPVKVSHVLPPLPIKTNSSILRFTPPPPAQPLVRPSLRSPRLLSLSNLPPSTAPSSLPRAMTMNAKVGGMPTLTVAMREILGHSERLLELYAQSTKLKLYVYQPPLSTGWCAANLTARFPKCQTFQWSGDWELTERMRTSGQATTNGDAADFYVVPFLSKCYLNFAAHYKLKPMDAALQQVLAFLRRTPWWDRHPERHLFFFMSGIGAGSIPSWRSQIASAIFVVAEGDRQADYFREGHDIVVPGKISTKHRGRTQQTDPVERSRVAVFRGSLDAALRDANGGRVRRRNRLRRWIFDVLEGRGKQYIFSGHKSKKYVQEMDDSRFCIIPRGNTPWTRRFFDAVVRGCIPAILSDPVCFPFERILDYRSMTLKLPEQWADKLPDELRSVNASELHRLHGALQVMWPAFVYSTRGVAFEMLLLELAARKHNFYARWPAATLNSVHHFWTPARGTFVLPASKKVGPSWGAGAHPHR